MTVDADLAAIRKLIARFFAAFTSGDDVPARMDDLRSAFVPGAIVVRTCGPEPEVSDVESFIAPRAAILADGSLTDFREWPTGGRIDVFGDVAHWFGAYAKTGRRHGGPADGAGMKSMQFVRTGRGWRISAAAWDDERAGLRSDGHHTAELGPA